MTYIFIPGPGAFAAPLPDFFHQPAIHQPAIQHPAIQYQNQQRQLQQKHLIFNFDLPWVHLLPYPPYQVFALSGPDCIRPLWRCCGNVHWFFQTVLGFLVFPLVRWSPLWFFILLLALVAVAAIGRMWEVGLWREREGLGVRVYRWAP
ncbi:hypothetical protein EDC01DRAFT_779654 [Geopyxis carbonaria]|nr:hypothetical protein EDC01DRAFT_779654 [Geopyxis carbonaria]